MANQSTPVAAAPFACSPKKSSSVFPSRARKAPVTAVAMQTAIGTPTRAGPCRRRCSMNKGSADRVITVYAPKMRPPSEKELRIAQINLRSHPSVRGRSDGVVDGPLCVVMRPAPRVSIRSRWFDSTTCFKLPTGRIHWTWKRIERVAVDLLDSPSSR